MARVFRAPIIRMAIGLMALAVTACGGMPAAAPAPAAHPPRFLTIVAALTSDRVEANTDLAGEKTDIRFGDRRPASQRCYILASNVRYDFKHGLDQEVHAETANDANGLRAQFGAKRQELVNLQQYNLDFANNGVTGTWATTAIGAMLRTMKQTANAANISITTVNDDIDNGYRQYQVAWQRWGCPASKALQGPPAQIPKVKVPQLPKPDP